MGNHSADNLMLGGLALIVLVIGASLALWWIHDQPAERQRFSWHQLIKNNFHISLFDELGKQWIIDIYYDEDIELPSWVTKGDRSLRVQFPEQFTRTDFIKFAEELSDIEETFSLIIKGVINEKALLELKFGRGDLVAYRDFKRHLLLKALKRL